MVEIDGEERRAHIPNGWRYTKDGWQHTSTWMLDQDAREPMTINQLIDRQQQREPEWMQGLMERVRSWSPAAIAMSQILLILLIVRIGNYRTAIRLQSPSHHDSRV